MKSIYLAILTSMWLAAAQAPLPKETEPSQIVRNRAPLAPSAFDFLPLTSVKPKGWLLRQLQIQADGQTGHLDEFWPSLDQKQSAWLGGSGEGWERGPYYLDGLVPLAHLLGDPKLIAKSNKWVEWTLANQRPDGSIGPPKNDDWWPNMIMLKVLTQHYEATGDTRVIPLMEKYLLHHLANAEKRPLRAWAIFRSADEAVSATWLYNRTGNPKLLELIRLLQAQGFNWKNHYNHFVYPLKVNKTEANLSSHVVNNAMAIKTSAVFSLLTKDRSDRDAAFRLFEVMDKYHLMPQGVHGGDEHYAGRSPVQGTELCAVVEAMYSIEHLLSILGRPEFGDRLEKMTYNALPATLSADMWTHQYDQQANQVMCSRAKRDWSTNGPDSNLFGLEPNFGCCTANFHQGWPKFIANLWMSSADGGLAAVAYGPNEVNTTVANGVPVKITEDTEYPFRDSIRLTVEPSRATAFPLLLRIPAWAEGATAQVNREAPASAKPGTFHRIQRQWKPGDVVLLKLPMKLRASEWYNASVAVERGPLVYALRVGEEWRKLKDYGPVADYEVHPKTPWNYALQIDLKDPARSAQVSETPIGDYPFSAEGAPVRMKMQARRLPGWKLENDSAAPPPTSPVLSKEPLETVELIPTERRSFV
ncbi:MAG: beta-L-arabinofuranosidase domain-containing protein [Bryobacteraceae bacterium]